MSDTHFYSKILLFGEYTILKTQKLSIPYRLYKGSLKFGELKKKVKESNNILIRFVNI